jgi:hypothetical protein
MKTTYPPEAIDYFMAIALSAQFGDSSPKIKKWHRDIRIQVLGKTTLEDMKTLRKTIEELNDLMTGINIFQSYVEPNVSLYFAPESDFKKILPEYVPTYDGFFWLYWDENRISEGKILISDRDISQTRRDHNIRQMITRSLGFVNNSAQYPESIFYSGFSETTEFSEIDKTLIKMLYNPHVRHSQTENEVRKWLAL